MAQTKKKEIVTVYPSGNILPVDEKEKPRFIEKNNFDSQLDKRRIRVAEREVVRRVKHADGSSEEHIYRERFKKKDGSKKK